MVFNLDTQQNYRAAGRAAYAVELAREGAVAMDKGEYAAAANFFQGSAEAYPHPTVLRRLGICLLLDRKPADAVLYLAAAVTLSNPSRRTRPLLLLAKALLTAGNDSKCVKLLKEGLKTLPRVVRGGVIDTLREGLARPDLHRLIDELFSLIPQEQDVSDAQRDPPVDYTHLVAAYRLKNVDTMGGVEA